MAAKKPGAQATVTLKHLAAKLSESREMSKKQTEAMLGDLVNLVTKHLKKGDRIRIGGLGIMVVRKRAARMGRNPATGEPVQIKAPQVVGTTPDGVKILRPIARPKHFTSKEIRKAISDAKRAATG
jgi:DNA-binding protein HU-beta